MTQKQESNQVVFTNKARCRDCYRCIRICPVHAIGIRDGQAYVDPKKCICCGTCIRECPQQAKVYRNDLETARELVGSGRPVAVSLAPSFAAFFAPWQQNRLPSALRKLGFSYIAETSVGAYPVAMATHNYYKENPDTVCIATACPAVVGFIERIGPRFVNRLAPVVSPMIAHARMLKTKLGKDSGVLFIGPCVAKKAEIARYPDKPVDIALTFGELVEWFEKENIRLADLEESPFDQQPSGWSRTFALAGGALKTACEDTDILAANTLALSGVDEIREWIESGSGNCGMMIEPLFCRQGCINGPAVPPNQDSLFQRRKAVLEYGAKLPVSTADEKIIVPITGNPYRPTADIEEPVNEEVIRIILEMSGKKEPSDQLNCGACGYSSCRLQAIAVYRQMAEPEMCIPFMRRLAEQKTDQIIETSPNGIVTLDEHLNILNMNPSFRRMFMCSTALYGKHISILIDPDMFEKVAAGCTDRMNALVEQKKYGKICQQIIYALPQGKQYVGIFVDMTQSLSERRQLDDLRSQTLQQAQNLLSHQIDMARHIAQFLGQSTAQGQTLVDNLMRMAQDKTTAQTPQQQ
jgi:iron only hydrogenase large subunit-like protein/uncharacterized Fe-S cluster-containing protein